MTSWPLIGRTAELAAIAAAIGSGADARGVVLCGPSGVGKTRLCHEAAEGARRRGMAVHAIVGTAAGRAVPMGALAAWTDRVDGDPLPLVEQVGAALSDGPAPVLMAVDDAHLLDDLSAFVVAQLVSRGTSSLIATQRAGEPLPAPISGLCASRAITRMNLNPLSRTETEALLARALDGPVRADCADRLWSLTRGNVLYLRELIAQERRGNRLAEDDDGWSWTGELEVTRSLIELVELQFGDQLGALADVVDLVAAAEPVQVDTLCALAGAESVAQALRRGLICSDGDMARTVHPLYGEVRIARAGSYRMRRLRGRIAAALAAKPDADPVRTGLFWLESDLPADVPVLLRAAAQSVARLDLALADRFASAAMDVVGGTAAALMHAYLLVMLNQGEQAERILVAVEHGEMPELVRANLIHLRVANLLWPLAKPELAWKMVDTLAEGAPGPILEAHLRAMRAVLLAMAGRPAEVAPELAGVDRDRLLALPDMFALWALAIAAGDLGDPASAANYAEEAYRRAVAEPEASYQGMVGIVEFLICALAFAGLVADATAAAERVMHRCSGTPGFSASVAVALDGMAALFAGDLGRSVPRLIDACAAFDAYGDTTGMCYRYSIVCTEALARAGRIHDAVRMQSKMHAARHPAFVLVEPDALLADAWVAANRGRLTTARTLARRAAETARAAGQPAREVYGLQVLLQFGSGDRDIAGRLAELTDVVGGLRASIVAGWARALAGDDPDALLATGADLAGIGDELAGADAVAQAAVAYQRRGRKGSALAAVDVVGTCVAERGVCSPAVTAVIAPLPLTVREREIAMLLAEGLSNSEIAAELGCSVRTVEGHTLRACQKIAVTGRRRLGEYVRNRQPFAGSDTGRSQQPNE